MKRVLVMVTVLLFALFFLIGLIVLVPLGPPLGIGDRMV